jgi:hypothetical protein
MVHSSGTVPQESRLEIVSPIWMNWFHGTSINDMLSGFTAITGPAAACAYVSTEAMANQIAH